MVRNQVTTIWQDSKIYCSVAEIYRQHFCQNMTPIYLVRNAISSSAIIWHISEIWNQSDGPYFREKLITVSKLPQRYNSVQKLKVSYILFYSFTDPNGNTVVVKYRAGRNGFEILNPEEVLPKAPQAYWFFFTLNSRH